MRSLSLPLIASSILCALGLVAASKSSSFPTTAMSNIVLPPSAAEPGQFRLLLVEGIRGGFLPPKVRRAIEITGDANGAVVVNAQPEGAEQYDTKEGELSASAAKALADRLRTELSALPTQSDPPSEDWYGLDTGIEFQAGDFYWQNGAPGGCTSTPSAQALSEDNKSKFSALVDYVKNLSSQTAQAPSVKAII